MTIYLTSVLAHRVPCPSVGYLLTPAAGVRRQLHGKPWAADNGCFSLGAGFRLQYFETWLEAMDPLRASCLFAVAPDVVGDAAATIARSLPVLPRLRAFGYRAAFAAQNGQESLPVPWDAFDALFLGGIRDQAGREWKLSPAAGELAAEAKARGKWVHMGRVNSRRRLQAAQIMGCDSADGTFARFRPNAYAERLQRWMGEIKRQPGLLEVL